MKVIKTSGNKFWEDVITFQTSSDTHSLLRQVASILWALPLTILVGHIWRKVSQDLCLIEMYVLEHKINSLLKMNEAGNVMNSMFVF